MHLIETVALYVTSRHPQDSYLHVGSYPDRMTQTRCHVSGIRLYRMESACLRARFLITKISPSDRSVIDSRRRGRRDRDRDLRSAHPDTASLQGDDGRWLP